MPGLLDEGQYAAAANINYCTYVYGHNDFFKNNRTFCCTRPKYVLEEFKSHADRIRGYIEDPSIGLRTVEEVLDAAHALKFQCHRNLKVKKLSLKHQRERALARAQQKYKRFDLLKKRVAYEPPDLHKIPLEPEEDLLLFYS